MRIIPQRGYRLNIEPEAVKAPPRRTVLQMSRLSSAVLGLLVLGLAAHALNLHGSSIHLAGAAAVIGKAFFIRGLQQNLWVASGSGS